MEYELIETISGEADEKGIRKDEEDERQGHENREGNEEISG